MFKFLKQQPLVDADKKDLPRATIFELLTHFQSHSFSINSALALFCCQPCKMYADGNIVCKI